jgi:hypothetical protein
MMTALYSGPAEQHVVPSPLEVLSRRTAYSWVHDNGYLCRVQTQMAEGQLALVPAQQATKHLLPQAVWIGKSFSKEMEALSMESESLGEERVSVGVSVIKSPSL